MEKEKEKDLYIPANCSPLDYVIEGFTGREITYIGVTITIAIILAISIYASSENSIQAVFLAAVIISAAILFFRRDIYGENSIDKIKLLMEYMHSVKKYEYTYVNIYEKEESETNGKEKF